MRFLQCRAVFPLVASLSTTRTCYSPRWTLCYELLTTQEVRSWSLYSLRLVYSSSKGTLHVPIFYPWHSGSAVMFNQHYESIVCGEINLVLVHQLLPHPRSAHPLLRFSTPGTSGSAKNVECNPAAACTSSPFLDMPDTYDIIQDSYLTVFSTFTNLLTAVQDKSADLQLTETQLQSETIPW